VVPMMTTRRTDAEATTKFLPGCLPIIIIRQYLNFDLMGGGKGEGHVRRGNGGRTTTTTYEYEFGRHDSAHFEFWQDSWSRDLSFALFTGFSFFRGRRAVWGYSFFYWSEQHFPAFSEDGALDLEYTAFAGAALDGRRMGMEFSFVSI
jgi:hypothetical protein